MLQDIRSFLLKQMLLKTLIFLLQSLYSDILDKHAPINQCVFVGTKTVMFLIYKKVTFFIFFPLIWVWIWSVNSARYMPQRFASWYISTPIHLPFGR